MLERLFAEADEADPYRQFADSRAGAIRSRSVSPRTVRSRPARRLASRKCWGRLPVRTIRSAQWKAAQRSMPRTTFLAGATVIDEGARLTAASASRWKECDPDQGRRNQARAAAATAGACILVALVYCDALRDASVRRDPFGETHPPHVAPVEGAEAPPIRWGHADPRERGPIIGSTSTRSQRNVIGTHSGSYASSRSPSRRALLRGHKPDLTNTMPTDPLGPFRRGATPTRSCRWIPLARWSPMYSATPLRRAHDIRPTIAMTEAHIDMPEVHRAIAAAGRLKADGKILLANGSAGRPRRRSSRSGGCRGCQAVPLRRRTCGARCSRKRRHVS
jgi:hypothetical protein